MPGKTLFEKIWTSHVVSEQSGHPALLYVDLHLLQETTSSQAFDVLRDRRLKVSQPMLTVATADHVVPTNGRQALPIADTLIRRLEENCLEHGITFFGPGSPNQGIVHVIGPELGLTQPGMTITCGDSHTSTHGALGALGFGIGTTEVAHVLATQCVLQRRPKTLNIHVEGALQVGVTAKDLILFVLATWGIEVGRGRVVEYTGPTIRGLSMEGRLTVSNMTIELGARAGLIGPDDVTFAYLRERPHSPTGKRWDDAVSYWRSLSSDHDAVYDATIRVKADAIAPMVTYGTTPAMGIPIDGTLPDPAAIPNPGKREAMAAAIEYMGLRAGAPLLGTCIDVVFIGSCTNGRIEDLRAAAAVLRGRKVSRGVRAVVVAGSRHVKHQAEREGLDRIFMESGAEWRDPGCGMCVALNGDQLQPGQYAVSTSNRNFQGRQGKGSRTFLASPLTAAASAIAGCVSDPREYLAAASGFSCAGEGC